MLPRASKKPVTPTTAFSLRSAKVVAGSSRSTLPALSCSCSAGGRAPTSTLRPTDSAVFGLTPPPTPPCFSPAMALWSCSASPQNASSPNVSNRKVWRPSRTMRLALSSITLSKPEGTPALTALPAGSTARTAPTSPTATSTTPTDNLALRGITIGMAILLWDGTESDCDDYRYHEQLLVIEERGEPRPVREGESRSITQTTDRGQQEAPHPPRCSSPHRAEPNYT